MKITMDVLGVEPEAQARPRFFSFRGKPRTYSPKTAFFNAVLRAARLRRPQEPLDGPLSLTAAFAFRRHASVKRDQVAKWTRPDADNLLKGVMDALTAAGWWPDDGRVCSVGVSKSYCAVGQEPGVVVRVCRLEDPGWKEPS